MLHKPDKEPIYGVRGSIPFFKEWLELFFQKERTYEKTFVFSHALFEYLWLFGPALDLRFILFIHPVNSLIASFLSKRELLKFL